MSFFASPMLATKGGIEKAYIVNILAAISNTSGIDADRLLEDFTAWVGTVPMQRMECIEMCQRHFASSGTLPWQNQ